MNEKQQKTYEENDPIDRLITFSFILILSYIGLISFMILHIQHGIFNMWYILLLGLIQTLPVAAILIRRMIREVMKKEWERNEV